jgi:uncharacterized protein (DUF433 family)
MLRSTLITSAGNGTRGGEYAGRRAGAQTATMGSNDPVAFDRITFDPRILGGRACIRGMRITVSHIVALIAEGAPAEEILEDYPYLKKEDIQQALDYAADSREKSRF